MNHLTFYYSANIEESLLYYAYIHVLIMCMNVNVYMVKVSMCHGYMHAQMLNSARLARHGSAT